jgi:hypothetical protein
METIDTKEGMVRSTTKDALNWSKDMAPALTVLLVAFMFSFMYGDSALLTSWQAACKAPLRFFRFALVLSLPLYALPGVYRFIIQKKTSSLLQIEEEGELSILPAKHWIFRPFQGIGIGLLFGTKLLTILQLIAGPTVGTSLLIPEGHFQFARLLTITLITVFVSLLLSTLWTLDDLGIRYFNRKDQEVKMIGKYAGTLMPVILGFTAYSISLRITRRRKPCSLFLRSPLFYILPWQYSRCFIPISLGAEESCFRRTV